MALLTSCSTIDALQSTDSIETLRAIAVIAEVAIAARECGHAASRRLTQLRSVQTHALSLSDLSAEFVHHQVRVANASWYGGNDPNSYDPRVAAGEVGSGYARARKKGGGAWRAFVHARGQGTALQNMQELAKEYHALAREAMAEYVVMGNAAVVALKDGALRGFSVSASQLANIKKTTTPHGSSTEPNVADDGAILLSNEIDNRVQVALRSCKDEQHRCRETSREAMTTLVNFCKVGTPSV